MSASNIAKMAAPFIGMTLAFFAGFYFHAARSPEGSQDVSYDNCVLLNMENARTNLGISTIRRSCRALHPMPEPDISEVNQATVTIIMAGDQSALSKIPGIIQHDFFISLNKPQKRKTLDAFYERSIEPLVAPDKRLLLNQGWEKFLSAWESEFNDD